MFALELPKWSAMTTVYIIFLVLLYLAQIAGHEAMHVVAMKELGLEIEYVKFGSLWPYVTLRPKWLPVPLRITPFPFTAKVKMRDSEVENVLTFSARQQAWIFGGGIVFNVVTGLVLLTFYLVTEVALVHEKSPPVATAVAFGCLVAAFVAWMLRRYVCMLMLPLGLLGIMVVVSQMLIAAMSRSHAMPSPALNELFPVHTFDRALFVGAFLSVLLGAYNAFPLYGQDGATLLAMTLHRRFGDKGVAIAMGFSMGLLALIMLIASSSFLVALMG